MNEWFSVCGVCLLPKVLRKVIQEHPKKRHFLSLNIHTRQDFESFKTNFYEEISRLLETLDYTQSNICFGHAPLIIVWQAGSINRMIKLNER